MPPMWCICSFKAVALADPGLCFVEYGERMVIDDVVKSVLDGKPPKKVIVVPGRIVNVVM